MNQRITWSQLPQTVRDGVENIVGEAVTEAESQPGGFSPGSADRVQLASGRRAFVEAASSLHNASTPGLHRREAAVTAALPQGVLVPDFLGMYDDGTWVALVLADVAGRHPQEPWVAHEVVQVLDALVSVGQLDLPAELELPRYQEFLQGAFLGWEKLRSRPLDGMVSWAASHLEQLVEVAQRGTLELAGDTLVHGDLRADDILLTGQDLGAGPWHSRGQDAGRFGKGVSRGVVFLDWPWAARGAAWVDGLSVLINVKTLNPSAQVDQFFETHPVFAGTNAHAITAVMAGWAGYFLDMSRRPRAFPPCGRFSVSRPLP